MVTDAKPEVPPGVELLRDVEFGRGGERVLKMNLLLPKARSGPAPCLLFLHGGAWLMGDRNTEFARPEMFRALCSLVVQGFVCALGEYRLSHEALFPAQVQDCKCAVRFLRAHAEAYGIDAARVATWGASAGAHLAALLGTSGGVAELEGDGGWAGFSSRVQAVVTWFAPTDFTRMGGTHDDPDSPEARLIGGPVQQNREKAARASPITYITAECPPFFIAHGAEDAVVPASQSELLHAALRKAGVESDLCIVPGKGHEYLGDEAAARTQAFLEGNLRR